MQHSRNRLTVTVVIPAYNEESNIARSVRQVLDERWTAQLVLESVIVVDDCSTDRTPEIVAALRREDGRVQLLRHAERRGKNAGIRGAATMSRSDVTAVMDADVLLAPRCLAQTLGVLLAQPSMAAASCIIKPLPARTWRERASRSQALGVAEVKRCGHGYLSVLYAIRAPAIGALTIPDGVADDAYITCWLRAHGQRYHVHPTATAYIRAATGLRDFARQTLRGRYAERVTTQAVGEGSPAPRPGRRTALVRALVRASLGDPLGFALYVLWYAVIVVTPRRMWLPTVSLSTFDTAQSTKDISFDTSP